MAKLFRYRGHTLEELKNMSIEEFSKLLTAKERRSLKRGLTENEKKLIENIKKQPKKFHKTHLRDMIILPQMVDTKIGIHMGGAKKTEAVGSGGSRWISIVISPEMIGHRVGEFAMTNKRVKHSSPGIGATRGSKHVAIK